MVPGLALALLVALPPLPTLAQDPVAETGPEPGDPAIPDDNLRTYESKKTWQGEAGFVPTRVDRKPDLMFTSPRSGAWSALASDCAKRISTR